jgi:endonuclease/exonuclease/phosphatase family metal-dependent hydrolase
VTRNERVQRWTAMAVAALLVIACCSFLSAPTPAAALPAAKVAQGAPSVAQRRPQAGVTDTAVSHVTWNMAGAHATYGATHAERRANASLIYFVAAQRRPIAIALQEVCRSRNGIPDAWDYLLETLTEELDYTWYWVTTGKYLEGQDCEQMNVVFTLGTPVEAEFLLLPWDGVENRVVACFKTTPLADLTACSTHLGRTRGVQIEQSNAAHEFVEDYGGRFTWIGGDYNAVPDSDAMLIWYGVATFFYESDRFLERPTHNTDKIDYGFGEPPNVRSERGALLTGEDEFSDHALLWAPYTWVA